MKLNTSQLKDGENLFEFSSSKNDWVRDLVTDISKEGSVLKSPIDLNLSLTKLEPDYYLKGSLKTTVEQCCARCAENFDLNVQYPFSLALVHSKADRREKKVEISEDSEELDITYFEGPEIELNPLIKEQFYLSLPYQAVCKADCLGVCQTCGQNLNVKICDCAKNALKPSPFDALKTLKVSI